MSEGKVTVDRKQLQELLKSKTAAQAEAALLRNEIAFLLDAKKKAEHKLFSSRHALAHVMKAYHSGELYDYFGVDEVQFQKLNEKYGLINAALFESEEFEEMTKQIDLNI